jgi:hypothetical protein
MMVISEMCRSHKIKDLKVYLWDKFDQ